MLKMVACKINVSQGQNIGLMNVDGGNQIVALFGPVDASSIATARRFMACVNALEGVDDDDIEEAGEIAKKLFPK